MTKVGLRSFAVKKNTIFGQVAPEAITKQLFFKVRPNQRLDNDVSHKPGLDQGAGS